MNPWKSFRNIAMVGAAGALTLASAQAATVVTAQGADQNYDPGTPGSGYPSFWTANFSTVNDVLYGLTPVAVGDSTGGGYATRGSVTDGTLTTIPSSGPWPMFQAVGTGPLNGLTSLTYTLGAATQLSSIQYYGGWSDNGRCSANFTISYSTDNGLTYTPLIDPTGGYYSTLGDPTDTQTGGMNSGGTTTFTRLLGGIGPISNYIDVTDNSGLIGSGALITNLKFDFGSGPEGNGWDGLEQLVAVAAPVPEPGVCVLFGGGLLSLLIARKRTKS